MPTKNDKVILDLKKEIESKKKLLSKTTKFNPVTNCSLTLNNVNYNLHTLQKDQLLLLLASVSSLQRELKTILPEEKLIISGFSSDSWIVDITSKFNNLNISLEKERLKTLEGKLHNLLSSDTKVSLEIEDLKSQIHNDK